MGEIDVTFELDINGILKMSAIQLATEENVQATFKSSRGKKKLKSKLVEEIVSAQDTNKILISRAEKLLKNKDLNKDDKNELTELTEKFKNAVLNNENKDIISNLEEEILDLLFYLEN